MSSDEGSDDEEDWETTGSRYLGRTVARRYRDGGDDRSAFAKVIAWLPASDSDFFDADGRPAPLYKIEYIEPATLGREDLEEHEIEQGLMKDRDAKCAIAKAREDNLLASRRVRHARKAKNAPPPLPPPPISSSSSKKKKKQQKKTTEPTPKRGRGRPPLKKVVEEEDEEVVEKTPEPEPEPSVARSRPMRGAAVKAISRGFNGAEEPEMAMKRRTARLDLALRATQEVAAEFGALWLNRKAILKRCRMLALDEDEDLIGEVTASRLDDWLKCLVSDGHLATKGAPWYALAGDKASTNEASLLAAAVYDVASSSSEYPAWRDPRRKAVIVLPEEDDDDDDDDDPQQQTKKRKAPEDDDDDDDDDVEQQAEKKRRIDDEAAKAVIFEEAAIKVAELLAYPPRKPRTARAIHKEATLATCDRIYNIPALGWHRMIKERLDGS